MPFVVKTEMPSGSFTASLGQKLVSVVLGGISDTATVVSVHEILICDASKGFDKIITDRKLSGTYPIFVNARFDPQGARLYLDKDGVTTGIFYHFVKWLYSRDLVLNNFAEVVSLYAFALDVGCNELHNSLMDAIQDYCRTNALPQDYKAMVMQLTAGHRKNSLMAFCGVYEKYNDHKGRGGDDAVEDILDPTIRGEMVEEENLKYRLCFFHKHIDGDVCRSKPSP